MSKPVSSTPTLPRAEAGKFRATEGENKPTCPVPTPKIDPTWKALVDKNSFRSVATEIAELTAEKNAAYGDAFSKSGDFLRLLYPDGIRPEQYGDALALVRIFDKQMRIANRKDAFGENPYRDIAGYGLLGAVKDA